MFFVIKIINDLFVKKESILYTFRPMFFFNFQNIYIYYLYLFENFVYSYILNLIKSLNYVTKFLVY